MIMIKILLDAHVIGGEGQGSATYLKGLYNILMQDYADYYEVFIAGYNYEELRRSFYLLEESHFVPLQSHSTRQRLFVEFPAILATGHYDFAHFQYIIPFGGKTKFITTVHDVLFNDFKKEFPLHYRLSRNFLFKRSLKKSAIKLTVSNYSRKAIAHHYKINESEILVTPNAVKPVFFEPYNKAAAQSLIKTKFGIENYILYVSRIEPRKNHESLLKAFQEMNLAAKDITLVLIGNDTMKHKAFEQAIENLTLEEQKRFKWIKYVEDEDLMAFYQGARIFVYPSKAEGFGIPPIEAAALKIDTISSNTTSMEDFDFLGKNLISPNDLGAFKARLKVVLENPLEHQVLESIANQIEMKYSWKKSAQVLHEAIQKEQINKVRKETMVNTKPL